MIVVGSENILCFMHFHIFTVSKWKVWLWIANFGLLSGRFLAQAKINRHHRQITDKSCVISALDDEQTAIKLYLYHAALKQGLSLETHVTALADGANSCWSAISLLKPHCQTLEHILDWLHIGMKF